MLSDRRKERNRDSLGQVLKDARVKQGYTQKALADALGLEYYTMISQMELGYISIPATLWLNIARVLQMETYRWVLLCLNEYQPDVYRALFNNRSISETETLLVLLHKGQLDDLLAEKANDQSSS